MLSILLQMLGGAVGLPTSAAAAASAAAVAVAAHKQFHPNSPPLDLDSWKEAFLQQASNANGNNARKEVSFMKDDSLLELTDSKLSKIFNYRMYYSVPVYLRRTEFCQIGNCLVKMNCIYDKES